MWGASQAGTTIQLCACAEAEGGGLECFGSAAAPYRPGCALHPGPWLVLSGRRHEPGELHRWREAGVSVLCEAGLRGSARARATHPAASRAGILLPRRPGSASGGGEGGALVSRRNCRSPGVWSRPPGEACSCTAPASSFARPPGLALPVPTSVLPKLDRPSLKTSH